MLIKVFPHGHGSGKGPVNYVVGTEYHGREACPPTVLRGDPDLTRRLIDDCALQGRKWNFTAGVIAGHPEDVVTPKKEAELMDAFEKLAFAGMPSDTYNILWVKHEHAGHHELHFVIPRMELSTGKAFNAFPPKWEKDFGVLRDLFNEREGWAKPDDPARERARQPGNNGLLNSRRKRRGLPPKEDPRETIHTFVEQRIESGHIHNRQDIIMSLQEVGLEISRVGQNYITATMPENGDKYRLKGGVYDASWNTERAAAIQIAARQNSDRSPDKSRVAELERQLEQVIAKRAGYNRSRYERQEHGSDSQLQRNDGQVAQGKSAVAENALASMDAKSPDRQWHLGGFSVGNVGTVGTAQQSNRHASNVNSQHGESRNTVAQHNYGTGEENRWYSPDEHQGRAFSNLAARHDHQKRLADRQTACVETGVNHDRVGTASHHESGANGDRASRAFGELRSRIDDYRKTFVGIGTACTAIERAMRGIRAVIAQYEREQQILTRQKSKRGLSR